MYRTTRIIYLAILPALLLFVSTPLHAAETDSIPAPVARALAKLQSIRSADLKYVMVERGLMSAKEKRDTVSMQFAGLHDSGHLALVIKARDRTILCEDSLMEWISTDVKSIYYDTVGSDQMLDRLSYWLFRSYMNGGKGLRWGLDSNRATMRYSDTTIDGKPLHWLTFLDTNDDPSDTMVGDQHIYYGIDNQDRIVRTGVTNVDFHQPMLNGRELVSSKINQTSRAEVMNVIRNVRQDVTKQGFSIQKKVTSTDREVKLIKTGDIVKNFSGRTPEGDSIEFASLHSKVTLLDFWYTGCGPCRYALPFLRTLQQKYGASGFSVVGLDPMDDEPPIVKLVMKSEALTNPEILVSREVSDTMFGISLYPTMILLDKNRKVQYIRLGYTKDYEAEIEAAIQKALQAK